MTFKIHSNLHNYSPLASRTRNRKALSSEFPQKTQKVAQKTIQSPKRYYPFSRTVKGRVDIQFSPGVKKASQRIVYKMKNVKTGESYTGKTGTGLIVRTSSHLSGVRHPEKEYGQKPLYNAIRQDPEAFMIGIQKEVDDDADLDDQENLCIIANGSIEKGFNKNLGRGGGRAVSVPVSIPDVNPATLSTPTKGYPLSRRPDGKIRVNLTPTHRKTRFITYGFRSDDGKWLIGETEQELIKRLYGYHHAFDYPETAKGSLPLPEAVRQNPSKFKFYILHQGKNVKGMEVVWIKAKKAFEQGFNQNRGGGGPAASQQKTCPDLSGHANSTLIEKNFQWKAD